MKISRNISNTLNWLMDNLIPPVLRDSKWFMTPLMRIVVGSKYTYYMSFKESVPTMSDEEIDSFYELLSDTFIDRDTDLNTRSVELILKSFVGDTIADIGCGRGYLAREILKIVGKKGNVHGFDVSIQPGVRDGVIYESGTILKLPYKDNFFDTTICCHTLEHIRAIDSALKELRRVTSKRLIIVVPRQREYRYTPDLHIHFFPYLHTFQKLIKSPNAQYYEIGHDLMCVEDFT